MSLPGRRVNLHPLGDHNRGELCPLAGNPKSYRKAAFRANRQLSYTALRKQT